MQLPIYQIDAFADSRFAGNPAAVVPLEHWPPDDVLLKIAQENNLAETAYFTPNTKGKAAYHLRWFTPGGEIDLCGHATVATAFVLHHFFNPQMTEVSFTTQKAGVLKVSVLADMYELDFPAVPMKATKAPENLAAALGIKESAIEAVLLGRDLAVVVNHEEQIHAAKPVVDGLLQLPGTGVLLTAAGKKFDVVSRCFYPKMSIYEDAVTGSAHSHLVPYWSKRLGKEKLICHQASERGGTLYCRSAGKRVHMAGKALLYMHGTIYV